MNRKNLTRILALSAALTLMIASAAFAQTRGAQVQQAVPTSQPTTDEPTSQPTQERAHDPRPTSGEAQQEEPNEGNEPDDPRYGSGGN